MRILTIACLLALPMTSLADVVSIPIPNQDWKITIDAPPLAGKREQQEGPNYVFGAKSGNFSISIFVEPPAKQGGSKECQEHYWSLSSRNPMISKPTVKTSNTDRYYRVEYDIVVPDAGNKTITQRNVNYYFAFNNKWVDIHISMIAPAKKDEATFAAFEKGLTYGK
jgi:hypothetical protein